jgi:hypothetical protein
MMTMMMMGRTRPEYFNRLVDEKGFNALRLASVSHACAAVRRAPASFTRSRHFNAAVHIGVVLGDLGKLATAALPKIRTSTLNTYTITEGSLFAHAVSKSCFFCNFRDILVAVAFLQDQLMCVERQVFPVGNIAVSLADKLNDQ